MSKQERSGDAHVREWRTLADNEVQDFVHGQINGIVKNIKSPTRLLSKNVGKDVPLFFIGADRQQILVSKSPWGEVGMGVNEVDRVESSAFKEMREFGFDPKTPNRRSDLTSLNDAIANSGWVKKITRYPSTKISGLDFIRIEDYLVGGGAESFLVQWKVRDEAPRFRISRSEKVKQAA